MKLMQAVLQLAGHDLRQFTEKKEYVSAVQEYLRGVDGRIVPEHGILCMPSLFSRPEPAAENGGGDAAEAVAYTRPLFGSS
jgi:hypothetical protein